ncbi:molybdopterin/thiamine biosynthesis adenylyltransferase [Actimicrobium sp. GrIS 1.19]|uniref:HesA/MoeB/ThiF family protein n=1 Tax=Actimicrobium sp. GrIS 1.19 TaxID=3071708 RepID=UPI002E083820|nr:molybdopterin/thiamine biosynthesis adenylyltransferase [Actimicrobium sp. GrIS 1.19]
MTDDQLLRYSRHILLDEIGIDGQRRIAAAQVLIVGAGGLGSPAAMYLAAAGVGKITLLDHDQVDLTNLQRQIVHTTAHIGRAKVDSARHTLAGINPDIEVIALDLAGTAANLNALIPGASVVLDCTDNFATRHAINRACVAHRVPLVSGAAIRFDGQVTVFDARDPLSPCYACLFPPDHVFEETLCSALGVFAPVVGIIGSMQAAEALKLILGIGTSLAGTLQMLDARAMEWNSVKVRRDPACSVCAHPSPNF